MKKIAVIDLGSNSVRMSIFDAENPQKEIKAFRSVIRLNEGMGEGLVLQNEAQERAVNALSEYKKIIENEGAYDVVAVATAAVRSAVNQVEFLKLVKENTGIKINVIDGTTEAALDALAVSQRLKCESGVICDIGGGSTELISVGCSSPDMISIPYGSGRICESFFASGETADSVTEALDFADRQLLLAPWLDKFKGTSLVGIGGTIRAVARLGASHTLRQPVESIELTPDEIEKTLCLIENADLKTRFTMPEIGKDRADIIMGGVVLLRAVLKRLEPKKIIVADIGVREGVLFDLIQSRGILKISE
ncbi:MAG: hypothetical protein IJV86_03585 [Clostridia bacterium]|nr:hypothetical protein [Clostridia bacterium]